MNADGTKDYVVFGAGAFLNEIFDLIHLKGGKVKKLFQNVPEFTHERGVPIKERIQRLGYEIELYDSLAQFMPEDNCEYVLGFTVVHKYRLVEDLKRQYGIKFAQLVHPFTYLSSGVTIGEGVILHVGSIIGTSARLDDHCLINRGTMIGHDTQIGKYSRIGPAAAIGGSCRIGDFSIVGIGACILERIHIGNWSVIGAGSVVTKDIPDGIVAYGSPARVVRENIDAEARK